MVLDVAAVSVDLNPREKLHKDLKGLNIHIPDLKPIFKDWKGVTHLHINQELDPLRCKVKERIRILDFDEAKQRRLQAADFALFTALWWPEAPFEKLQILAYLVIWLFTWDDEIDEPTGAYSDDMDAAQAYRAETLQYVRLQLGLPLREDGYLPKSSIVRSVDVICRALRESYNIDQRERFYQEISRFIAASEEEQKIRLDEKVPPLSLYWSLRLGTSAVYIGTACGEYSTSSDLPNSIMDHDLMKVIWNETNMIISITNDILSLKKELKHGGVDNVVTLIFNATKDIQRAVDESLVALQVSKLRFDKAAEELLAKVASDKQNSLQVARFIDVQRSNCIGNLIWSLQTDRYGMRESVNRDGSHTFAL